LDKKICIISGANRSGTTSAFNYLVKHDQINPSKKKETRFFLDENYAIDNRPEKAYHNSPDSYYSFFESDEEDKIYFEATPDYLYSKNTSETLKAYFADDELKLIFILRDPVTRFVSWYNYDKQLGNISSDMSFQAYFKSNLKNSDSSVRHLNRLANGNYSVHLKEYIARFEAQNIFVCFYEDLKAEPKKFVQSLCQFLNIDSYIIDNGDFPIYNQSGEVGNKGIATIYNGLRKVFHALNKNAIVSKMLSPLRSNISQKYNEKNIQKKSEILDLSALENYYKNEPLKLAKLGIKGFKWR